MGYVSLLEDNIQHLNSDLGRIRTEIEVEGVPTEKQKAHVRYLLGACERTLHQRLNTVTDPKLDTTFGVIRLQEDNARLNENLKSKDDLIKKLNKELSCMKGDLIEANRTIKQLKKDIEFMQNPDKFYDAYSSPEGAGKYK